MTLHLPKQVLAVATVAISQLGFALPTLAEEEEMNPRERYELCSVFPLNSRCEGYTAPLSLKQRPGNAAACKLQTGEIELKGSCKIVPAEGLVTVYVEEGEKLEILDDRKATREITVPATSVSNLRYRETSKIDIAEVLFITWLSVFKPDKFSEIEIVFTDATQTTPSTLTLVTDRDLGLNLKTQLERSTGRFAEIAPEEEPEEQPAQPTAVDDRSPEPTDLESFCTSFPQNSRCH
jgi:hypothetical protein